MREERGIFFDSIHTGVNWGLLLTACNKGQPEPKTNFISVEGRDGDLDYSEALTGEIRYNNRTDEYGFNFLDGTRQERQILMNKVYGFLHGRKRKIVLPDWPDYYSVGRLTVTAMNNYMGYGEMTVEANCEPWMYKKTDTIVTATLATEAQEITLTNSGIKTVIPTFETTGSATITFGSYETTIASGAPHKLLEISLTSGAHILKVKGSGTLKITWTEAIL